MKKTKSARSKKPVRKQHVRTRFLFVVLPVALLLGGFLVYLDGQPDKIRKIYYGHTVRQAFRRELKTLREPMDALGFRDVRGANSHCSMQEIATDGVNVSTELFCAAEHQAYTEVNASNKESIVSAAKELDRLMQQHDGTMSTNSAPTFEKWFTDVTSGVDYYPDITGTFVRDNYLCAVAAFVAYANPGPPAFSVTYVCNSPRVSEFDYYLRLAP